MCVFLTLLFCIMAEASLKATPTAGNKEEDNVSCYSSVSLSSKEKVGGVRKSNKLSMKELEGKLRDMDKRMDEKFDRLLESMSNLSNRQMNESVASVMGNTGGFIARPESQVQDTVHGPPGRRKPLVSLENSLDEEYGLPHINRQQDELSLQPSRHEMRELIDSDNESRDSMGSKHNNQDFQQYVSNENTALHQLFNTHDSVVSKDGIILDKSQIDLLSKSWRAENPDRISCYKDEYRQAFPVHESSENMLLVPGLDDLIEPMLQKRHGKLFKPWGKSKQLCTQPLKSIESLAFQGQLAARMNILAIAYLQQGLGSLLGVLQDRNVNIDKAVQTVRDLFSMSNKALDQSGRTGAYHQMIRRKAAITDTGLNTLKDVQSKVLHLPLTHDGVFGKGLESVLKHRKEQKDQLNDLVPEFSASKSYKRKYEGSTDRHPPAKKRAQNENVSTGRQGVQYSSPLTRAYRPAYSRANSTSYEATKGKKDAPGATSFRIPRKN